MQIPLIGVTSSLDEEKQVFSVPQAYIQAIVQAGGLPFVLPYSENRERLLPLFSLCDGLLLTGGDDLDPVFFNQEPHPKLGPISPLRDASELALCRLALAHGVPVFGICRGMQVLGVASGGAMIQDIPSQTKSQIRHRQTPPYHLPAHFVQVEPETRLASILGTNRIRVNSMHHQAMETLGEGCLATAHAADGIIEALEYPEHPFALGVQWHPERMIAQEPHMALFHAFLEAAALFQLARG